MKRIKIIPFCISAMFFLSTFVSCVNTPSSTTSNDSTSTVVDSSDILSATDSSDLTSDLESSDSTSDLDSSDSTSDVDSGGDSTPDIGGEEGEQVEMERITAQQLFNRIGQTSFKENVTTDEFVGLSNVSEVGVDQNALTTQLYAIPDDGEFATIFLVEDYGVSANNADNFTAMSALVRQVKETEGKKLIRFSKGVYKCSSKIVFENIEDLFIDGNNAEWLVTSWETAFHFNNCKRSVRR